jgi:hypothetical protein
MTPLRVLTLSVLLPLFPVRPGVGANRAALGAHHARAEFLHQEVARELVDVNNNLVPAAEAIHVERPDGALAHVRQVHLLYLVFGW